MELQEPVFSKWIGIRVQVVFKFRRGSESVEGCPLLQRWGLLGERHGGDCGAWGPLHLLPQESLQHIAFGGGPRAPQRRHGEIRLQVLRRWEESA